MSFRDTINNFSMCSEEKIKEVLCKLYFISSIKPSEKINTTSMEIQKESFLTSFYRSFDDKANKNETYLFFEKTINEGINLWLTFSTSTDYFYRNIAVKIKDALKKSIDGIKATKETYYYCTAYCLKLDLLIDMMSTKIKRDDVNINFISSEPIPIQKDKKTFFKTV